MYPLLGWTDRVRPRPAYLVFLIVSTTFGTASATRALGAPSAGEAQPASPEPPPAGMPLALEDAVRRANEVSALVRRARAESRRTGARRVEAEMWMPANPGVAVALGQQRDVANIGPTSGLGYRLRVEQQVEVGGPRGARIDEVARAVDGADARERLAVVEASARTRSAYVAALLGGALVRSTSERETLAARLEDSVRARVEAGAASEIELRLAEVERGRMHRERIDAERIAGEARAELLALLALGSQTPIALTTPLVPPARGLLPVDQALLLARAQRADLAALAASGAEIDAQIVRLRREALPSPALFFDVERDLPGQSFIGGGIAVPLPVWRRNQGPRAIAQAERARIDDERVLVARQVELEVDRAYRELRARREQARIQDVEVVPAAERASDLLAQGWQAGKFDLFRVIQARREAGEARRHQLETLGDLWQATIELDRAMGVGTP
jgi:cobalt-zinc-cadmium efflux system outer membrane protein